MIFDSAPLLAAFDPRDRHHHRCATFLADLRGPAAIPILVVAEVGYFLAQRVGSQAEAAFVRTIRDGEYDVEPVEATDWPRIHELVEQYADLGLGTTDASIVAACERLGETTLATLDHRHFGVVRPLHCDALTLVPE